jgi:pimeloyl-ACP methyl ester carboxylesterase
MKGRFFASPLPGGGELIYEQPGWLQDDSEEDWHVRRITMMRYPLVLLSVSLLFSLACSLAGTLTPTLAPQGSPTAVIVTEARPTNTTEAISSPAATALPAAPGKSASPCGDGVCERPENARNCPADCGAKGKGVPTTAAQTGQDFHVKNPSSGASLYVHMSAPADSGKELLPAVVLVPGGFGDSAQFRKPRGEDAIFSPAGYFVLTFDPDGRGQSQGKEDYNGFTHQDGLAEVIRLAATLPGVDPSRIGLVTYSFGITMGAGALARHPDLPVKFLVDWEGPANRDDTGGCDGAGLGHLKEIASCADEAFWSQREADRFIGQIKVPYQRVQSQKDHVQPDNYHAILMVNQAVAGGVPWVRLNDLAPNQSFDTTRPPAMLAEEKLVNLPQLMLNYLQTMFTSS